MATHVHAPTELTAADKTRLGRRAQLLAGASVGYNVIEAGIAITAGRAAGSVALVGFGLDSTVEISSGLIILWQFRHAMPENREQLALRLMAVSFFALARYVAFESLRGLIGVHDPDHSPVGIGIAVASLIIMPFLSWAQRRTGRALGSNAVVADSTQTLLCTYLSAVLLLGLVFNSTLGWSWADFLAGLVIAALAIKEGREAWRGEGCCDAIDTHDRDEDRDHVCNGCCALTDQVTADASAGLPVIHLSRPTDRDRSRSRHSDCRNRGNGA